MSYTTAALLRLDISVHCLDGAQMSSITKAPRGEVSPDSVAAFVQEIIVEYQSYKELVRRAEPREPVSIPVQVVKLDDRLAPISAPFHLVTRDISCGGVGLFHTEVIECGLVQLEFSSPFSGDSLALIARVQHCTPCGRYFIIGCQFFSDSSDRPKLNGQGD